VRAIIGGRDYSESPFNRATQARRQPGSAFKPFVYLAAFERGLGPHTLRSDEPVDFGGYMPANYGRNHSGAMSLHQALVRSVNTIAVQLGMEVGPSTVAAVAARLGIVSPLQPYASIALGTSEVAPMELTAAFAAFPAGGLRVRPYTVVEVRGIDGRVLYRHTRQEQQRVVENEKALWMNEMLYDVTQSGTGRAARVPRHEVAGKTGTTSGFKDAWFVGYSADLVTGVWVGNDNSRPMRRVTGGTLPAQIWSSFMRTALAGRAPLPIPRSEPPPPEIDIEYRNPWGFGATSDDMNRVEDDDRDSGEPNIGRWWFEGDDGVEFTPPPRRERMADRRALPPRAVQEGAGDWVSDPPRSREDTTETRRDRLRTYRQTERRRSDDGDNLGRNHAQQSSRSRAESSNRSHDDGPPPRTAWNPPPSNAIEAPPNATPPDENSDEDTWYRYE
jgi:membrane peptidoglycan carboxypeptidase